MPTVLTPDLVRVQRRGTELRLVPLREAERPQATLLAEQLIATAAAQVGGTREDLDGALAAISMRGVERRLSQGLLKLVEDRCDVESEVGTLAPRLRDALFTRSASDRVAGTWDRDAIIATVAAEFSMTKDEVERGMYSDLRAAHQVRAFKPISGAGLVLEYERAQMEAVLLRATRVTVNLIAPSAAAARLFFRRMKFLGLLCAIQKAERGYSVVIDGPLSLFEAGTSYGLKLALLSRSMGGVGPFELHADVLWGRERTPLVFRTRGEEPIIEEEDVAPSAEAAELANAWGRLDSLWTVKPTTKVIHIPGVGMSIPDLVFSRGTMKVYLEVLGYWSRAAVWRRVELAEAGLGCRMVFAVSDKLRVSEEVLGDDTPASLYVFKRKMSPRAILEKVETTARRTPVLPETTLDGDGDDLDVAPKRTRRRKARTTSTAASS